jgi:hypothetical protein
MKIHHCQSMYQGHYLIIEGISGSHFTATFLHSMFQQLLCDLTLLLGIGHPAILPTLILMLKKVEMRIRAAAIEDPPACWWRRPPPQLPPAAAAAAFPTAETVRPCCSPASSAAQQRSLRDETTSQ